ncbi:MAG: ankyrin repeat domain-containing protein [Parvularculales bacterium]
MKTISTILCSMFFLVFTPVTLHAQENVFLSWGFWKNATAADVQAEIERGSDIKDTFHEEDCLPQICNNGWTPLHYAVRYNHSPESVRVLIEHGVHIDAKTDYGQTPLHWAADYNEEPAIVKLLLDHGADIEARNRWGSTPLHGAVEKNKSAVIKALLERGADIEARDKHGTTPFLGAVGFNGRPDVLKLLIEYGADIEARDGKGRSALHWAAVRDDVLMAVPIDEAIVLKNIELLLDHGMDINVRDNPENATPLLWAAVRSKSPAVLELLLNRGADMEIRGGAFGHTPLLTAARLTSNPAIVETLLRGGADATAQDEFGRTAFELAKENESLKDTKAYWLLNEAQYR